MKIGIDVSRANKSHKTGTEWYAYYLVREFAQLDKLNEYILYTDAPLVGGLKDLNKDFVHDGSDTALSYEFDEKGYQILKSPHNNFKAKVLKWPFRYFWTLGGLSLEMLFNKPDVLFIPSHVLPIIHPKKSIVTIHDIGFVKDSSLFEKNEIGPEEFNFRTFINIFVRLFTFGKYGANSYDYLRWSTKYALDKASKIITVSYFTKTELIENYRFNQEKLAVVYNGYNKDLYRKIDDQNKIDRILEEQGVEQPYFFYIGRLEKKKNIAALIEAYAIMRDKYPDIKHKLVLIGDASFGFDEIKYMTREFDIVDDVIMPGWLDEDLIPYFYNGASAFVFPSKYEGFGIPLLQAMACEVPVAASRVSSIPEVLGEAAVYFHPDYSFSIAEAMHAVISDNDLRNSLIKKGLKRVGMFSWSKCAKETLDVITRE
jgi:glycosyltransferase involved in cell wall biosynthesis